MDINKILLICAAVIPAVALCIYVFKKDRVEKEPIGLLLLLFGLGVLSCFPAGELEKVMFEMIKSVFKPFAREEGGYLVLSGTEYKWYNATKYFIGVALVEEICKFAVLYFVTRKNKNFNSLFDGIVYAVFVSLGFAAHENILYVLKYGWVNAATRAVMSVPGHMFFAVLMGYYYSLWHMYKKAGNMERELKTLGRIPENAPEYSGKWQMFLCLLMPVLAHGFYDYCCTAGTTTAIIIFYGFLLFLYVYCFEKIKKMSKLDALDTRYSRALVFKKYPHLQLDEEMYK